ncbi:MAG: efflux RND transporter periplasmic adaptor subunit, partial [Terriglobales bacterium]
GIQRGQADYWAAEAVRARERLARTRLRSPIDGVVATPRVENLVGRRLSHGDSFAEITDSRRATVDVAIDEVDVPLLESGQSASVKLDAYPTRTFKGEVAVISPRSQAEEDQRVFFARVSVPNEDGSIRPGMQGRGKVSAGWHPAGYVLLRRTAMWVRTKLWSWFGV